MTAAMILHLSRPYRVQEYVEQFQELAAAYRLDQLLLVDPDGHAAGIRNIRPGRLRFDHVCCTAEALRQSPGIPVFLEEGQPFTLGTFQHPACATYVLGDDVGGLQVPSGALSVSIETATRGHLWSQQAAAVVLYDRHIKKDRA